MADTQLVMIPIIDGYYYTIDNLGNHTLYYKEYREKKALGFNGKGTGEFKNFVITIGYYPNMKWLYRSLISDSAYRKIERGEIKTAEEHLAALEDMTQRIEKLLNE